MFKDIPSRTMTVKYILLWIGDHHSVAWISTIPHPRSLGPVSCSARPNGDNKLLYHATFYVHEIVVSLNTKVELRDYILDMLLFCSMNFLDSRQSRCFVLNSIDRTSWQHPQLLFLPFRVPDLMSPTCHLPPTITPVSVSHLFPSGRTPRSPSYQRNKSRGPPKLSFRPEFFIWSYESITTVV